jgi:TonB family protein
MYCKHCGKRIRETAKFCGACGNPFGAGISPQPPTPAVSSLNDLPAHPESPRSRPEPVAAKVEAPKTIEAARQPELKVNAGTPNRKTAVIGISMALILGLAIGAASFYVLRASKRSDESMSTKAAPAAAVASPVATTAGAPGPAAPSAAQPAVAHASSATASACFDLSKREPHSLEGRLRGVIFPEQPNFTDVRKGDDPVEGYLLQLDTGVCIQGDDSGSADPTVQFSEVQVYPQNWDLKIEAAMRSMLGYQVRVELASAQAAMTGHDHRPLVAQVSAIVPTDANAAASVIPRTMSPRSVAVDQEQGLGEASTSVRAFYEALSIGSGEAASSLVVPEKRTAGPYAPDSISRFYGPLPEPLRLIELKPQGSSEYLVKYTYGTSTRRCQSRAIVTTTQRDGLNLIEKIHELEGCGAVSSSDSLSVADGNQVSAHAPIYGQEREPRQTTSTPSLANIVAKTQVRLDPQHPLRIGQEWYPDASKRANEQGRCIVQVIVTIDGRIAAEAIQASSGFPRLDEACLNAVRGQRMLPATENGKPVQTTVAIPIDWKLSNN